MRFKRPVGDDEPYLNAGPGRIPSSHKRLLGYLKQFGVDIEVYIMNTESNLVQMADFQEGNPVVYRRLDHNTRGWLAQMVYENAASLIQSTDCGIAPAGHSRTGGAIARFNDQFWRVTSRRGV